jgi:osmotically-inducible protein OsmY
MRELAVTIVTTVVTLAWGTVSADPREDSTIRLEARSQLTLQPAVAQEHLDVSVQDGTVHLSGSVGTLFQKWRASDAVAHVKGVTRVVDELELRSGPGSDSALADDVRRRFRDMPSLSRGSLSVEVSSGTVRISGRLDDARKRFDARDAAAKIPGVVAVVDAISSGDTSDGELAVQVPAVLSRRSVTFVAGDFDIHVEGGVVKLEGTVPRLWERILAERAALGVNGVKGVVNLLEVVPTPRADAYGK